MVRQHGDLVELSRKFVCLRMVKMNGVDLGQFQFDYDLSWAALFLNADGAVYARYGSRSAEGPMATNSEKGLLGTMRHVLEAHAGYPANRELFRAKRGRPPRFRRPELIPTLKPGLGGGDVDRSNCIHCHNVHEALNDHEFLSGRITAEKVFKYPIPETVGLVLDDMAGNRVARVLPDSPAARAGFRAGDILMTLDGQAILSIADVQFALHHVPGEAEVECRLRRGDERLERTLHLAGEWRRHDFTWRASMSDFPPSPELYLHTLEAPEKEKLGIDGMGVALEVRALFNPTLESSGLRVGDVIVGYDGRKSALSSTAFRRYLRVHHYRPDSRVKLRVLRAGKTVSLSVKLY